MKSPGFVILTPGELRVLPKPLLRHSGREDPQKLNPPMIYPTYRDMLKDDKLDAIVILTPDHLHARMAIDAASAGKHVYLEKPMCQTIDEAKALRDVVKKTGIALQVGHQNRQQASYMKARELVVKRSAGSGFID